MRRTAPLLAGPLLALTAVGTAMAPSGDVNSFVSVDADRDRVPSVGDTIRWFLDGKGVVTMRCWADDTKTALRQTYVSPAVTPKVAYEATVASVVLTSAGYCESTSSGGGLHWFMVVP